MRRHGWLLNDRLQAKLPREFYSIDFLVSGYAAGFKAHWPSVTATAHEIIAAPTTEACHALVGEYSSQYDPAFAETARGLEEQLLEKYAEFFADLRRPAA